MVSNTSRRSLLRAGALAFVAGSTGCLGETRFDARPPGGDSWPLPRYDPAGTAHNPHATPPRTITTDWRTSTALDIVWPAFIVAENTVVAGGRHRLIALDAATGDRRWQRETGASALGYREGIVYTAVEDDAVRAFRLKDGTQHWQTDFSSAAYGLVPTTANVFVAAHGSLLCLDAGTGDRQWRLDAIDGLSPTGIAVADGTAIHTSVDFVTVYEPSPFPDVLHSTPTRVWQAEKKGFDFLRPPGIVDGRVYVGDRVHYGTDAQVFALSVDGQLIWQTEPFGTLATTPALAGGEGYFLTARRLDSPSSSVALRALALDTGMVKWTSRLNQYGFTGPLAVADGVVISSGERSEVSGNGGG